MVFPGSQEIISDPAKPTNLLQTISQPDLVDPSVLDPPPALPNMVLLEARAPDTPALREPTLEVPVLPAPAEAQPPSVPSEPEEVEPAPPVQSEVPSLADPQAPVVLDPVLPLPQTPRVAPALMVVPSRVAEPPRKEITAEPLTKPAEEARTETKPKESETPKEPAPSAPVSEPTAADTRNFLAVSPIPVSPEGPIELPSGQAEARFAMSPQPNLAAPKTEPSSSETAAVSVGDTPPPGNRPKVVTIGFGGPAAAKDRDSSGEDTSAASGEGRPGSGPAVSVGSGSGSLPGPGRSPFAGLTVVGQGRATGVRSRPIVRIAPARPLQTSYGLTVVSTESSGGGLPFSGVFAGRQIRTVYLDMRESITDSAPSWTLEFAVPERATGPVNPAQDPSGGQQGIVLPFPAVKKPPQLPREVVLAHLREMIIVYGVINAEGKMEQMSVLKSPNSLLNDSLLRALSEWVFRPAQVDGAAVSVQVLVGIPLWLPE